MKRFSLALFAISFATLLGVFFTGYFVSAASPYDNLYTVTDNLILGRDEFGTSIIACDYIDYTSNWSELVAMSGNQNAIDSFNEAIFNGGTWGVSQVDINNRSNYGIQIVWSEDRINFDLASGIALDKSLLIYYALGANCDPTFNYGSGADMRNNFQSNQILFLNYDIIYPEGYEGEIIPDSYAPPEDPEIIYPQYNWTVSKDENDNGILTVKYQDNLPHFLTGTSTLEVIEFTENWAEIDESLGLLPATPAGWADWQFNIGQGQGWYMFRITHSQQLDVPPWGEDDNYYIGDVLYQFFWDGETFINGTTVGCDGIVCNEFTTPDSERVENSILSGLNVETFGLASIVTAPLNFFSQLPTKLDNCTPLNFPFHFGDITIPCMTSVYRENLGVLFTMYQTMLVGLFTYFLGLRIFGNIKDISNPKDNSIEVVKL